MHGRKSGVLMHLTCLPARFGIGDLGPEADVFVDRLAAARQGVWQLLPLSPTDVLSYNDPYHSIAAFAGNPLLISPELLVEDGLLSASAIASPPVFPLDHVDYPAVSVYKNSLLNQAVKAFGSGPNHALERFSETHALWLDDYTLFSALKARYGGVSWAEWPDGLRHRDPAALAAARQELFGPIHRCRVLQFLFHRQWDRLKARAHQRGVRLFGDMPIYVDYESADVWANPQLFKLGRNLLPTHVSGVPPDYFSATGQLWGTPVFDWPANEASGLQWWLARMHRNLSLFDMLRIDHFRGLFAYWEVEASAPTALSGVWVKAPGVELLRRFYRTEPDAQLVAEDLGVITPDVVEAREQFNMPGMKILQFAFSSDLPRHPDAPHHIDAHSVVYPGTHDNAPIRGWFDDEATPEHRQRLNDYLARDVTQDDVHWCFIRMALGSRAQLAVTAMQDLLGLGAEARMNRPGNLVGNWRWRMRAGAFTDHLQNVLGMLTELYGRADEMERRT